VQTLLIATLRVFRIACRAATRVSALVFLVPAGLMWSGSAVAAKTTVSVVAATETVLAVAATQPVSVSPGGFETSSVSISIKDIFTDGASEPVSDTATDTASNSVSDDELLAGALLADELSATEFIEVVDTRPVVYLTFDDGPSADTVTEELLAVLARHDATATFFVTGQRVKRASDKIAEIVYAGHAIGNHTLSHARLTEVSDKKALSELKTASEVILAAGGPPATCFRPPFGSTNRRINGLARQLGMVPVGWSIDTHDWKRSTSSEEINNALNRATAESIVLLHDGPSYRGKMLNAFSDWMDAEAHRFQFRALPECTRSGGVLLADARLPDSTPVATDTESRPESVVLENPPVVEVPPTAKVHTTIPELLAKIRAYRFDLQNNRRRVDLTQVTATLNSEIHGDHIFYSF